MSSRAILNAAVFLSGWAVAGWWFFGVGKPIAGEPAAPARPPEMEDLPRPDPLPEEAAMSPFEAGFREWSADPSLAGASIGFCLLDESGEPVFESPLSRTALCPASALKTVTTAAALEVLGPDFRFRTELLADIGISAAGVLDSDLTLEGSGDPTLSSGDLEALADALVKAGLKQVNGKLLVRGAAFGAAPASDHWNWGDIGNAYGAGAYGLNLDHNRISIRFRPAAREGDPATLLGREGPVKETRWVNEVLTGARGTGDRVVVYSEPFGRAITMRGTVPAGGEFIVGAALPDPPARVRELFEEKLAAGGVKILGSDLKMRAGIVTLAVHESAPLPEIIDHLHRVSDNLEAQCLFLTLGMRSNSDPAGTLRRHWENRGVAFTGLRLIDGSGLARANMIRPVDLARVNHLARRGEHGERFYQSLNAGLDGWVRAKLGSMSGVKTDVGFITMADGREFTFCLIANGLDPGLSFWPLRDKWLREIASR